MPECRSCEDTGFMPPTSEVPCEKCDIAGVVTELAPGRFFRVFKFKSSCDEYLLRRRKEMPESGIEGACWTDREQPRRRA